MTDRRGHTGFDHRVTVALLVFLGVALLAQLRVSRGPEAPASRSAVYPETSTPAPERPFLSRVDRALETIGSSDGRAGPLDHAIRELSEVLAATPSNARAAFGLGWAHQQRGRLDAAQSHYWSARLLSRASPTATAIEHFAHHNLATLYAQRRLEREAELESTMAGILTSDPVLAGMTATRTHSARFLYELAWSALARARTEEQRLAWDAALRAWADGQADEARRGFSALLHAAP